MTMTHYLLAASFVLFLFGVYCNKNEICEEKWEANIVIVVDSSSSISDNNFVKQKSFVKQLVQSLSPTKRPNVRIGLVLYSTEVKVLKRLDSNDDLLSVINNNLVHLKSGTNTAEALAAVRYQLFETNNEKRPQAHNVTILITDGEPNDQAMAINEATFLRNPPYNTSLFGIYVEANLLQLHQMIPQSHTFHIEKFDDLIRGKLAETIARKICTVEQSKMADVLVSPLGCNAELYTIIYILTAILVLLLLLCLLLTMALIFYQHLNEKVLQFKRRLTQKKGTSFAGAQTETHIIENPVYNTLVTSNNPVLISSQNKSGSPESRSAPPPTALLPVKQSKSFSHQNAPFSSEERISKTKTESLEQNLPDNLDTVPTELEKNKDCDNNSSNMSKLIEATKRFKNTKPWNTLVNSESTVSTSQNNKSGSPAPRTAPLSTPLLPSKQSKSSSPLNSPFTPEQEINTMKAKSPEQNLPETFDTVPTESKTKNKDWGNNSSNMSKLIEASKRFENTKSPPLINFKDNMQSPSTISESIFPGKFATDAQSSQKQRYNQLPESNNSTVRYHSPGITPGTGIGTPIFGPGKIAP